MTPSVSAAIFCNCYCRAGLKRWSRAYSLEYHVEFNCLPLLTAAATRTSASLLEANVANVVVCVARCTLCKLLHFIARLQFLRKTILFV